MRDKYRVLSAIEEDVLEWIALGKLLTDADALPIVLSEFVERVGSLEASLSDAEGELPPAYHSLAQSVSEMRQCEQPFNLSQSSDLTRLILECRSSLYELILWAIDQEC